VRSGLGFETITRFGGLFPQVAGGFAALTMLNEYCSFK
jgi:hypothetical protein